MKIPNLKVNVHVHADFENMSPKTVKAFMEMLNRAVEAMEAGTLGADRKSHDELLYTTEPFHKQKEYKPDVIKPCRDCEKKIVIEQMNLNMIDGGYGSYDLPTPAGPILFMCAECTENVK